MIKPVETERLYDCKVPYLSELFAQYRYPWELIAAIRPHIRQLISAKTGEFREYAPDVWIGENVEISSTATIEPPAIVGSGTVLRNGAFIRGGVITGRRCVIGNSTELKNCILLDEVQVPHYNYVGDSVLGNRAHMGAGAICSNLKADGKEVVVHGDAAYATGLRKVGSFLGDNADIGCGCVLNPGTVVGKRTSVYPLTALRGVYPEDCIVKSADMVIFRQ